MNILLKNGIIVTAEKSFQSDILISGDKISEISKSISNTYEDIEIIDVRGAYIFPGGIDPHVHMHLPSPAGYSADDFYTGSKAALIGGTTTIIDFVTPQKGQALIDAITQRKEEAKSSLIDYSFHVSPVEWRKSLANEIKACIAEGITSFKIYMAYLDTIGLQEGDLLRVMKAVGDSGGMVTIHCELGKEVDRLRKEFIDNGRTSPKYHPLSRPNYVESEAVKKAINIAKEADCSIYIVHVSAKESLKHIRKAQSKGQKVFAETCPQYLLLDDSKYIGGFNETAPFVLSPPLRKNEDNEALWQALADGTIQTVGTDHCPFTIDQKKLGVNDFTKIPNGAGGVEHRLALIYTYGVLTGRININRYVDLVSTEPAKIFGLYPQKGAIQVGSDADLVVWNPGKENIISAQTHHQNCDCNIYEGFKTRGAAEYVIVGGKLAIENGELINSEKRGKFLKRP